MASQSRKNSFHNRLHISDDEATHSDPSLQSARPIPATASPTAPSRSHGCKDLETIFDPSRMTAIQIDHLDSLGIPPQGFALHNPHADHLQQRAPMGWLPFFYDQLARGLVPPVPRFFTEVSKNYDIPRSQFLPNSISFMVGYFLICRWMGVRPDGHRFVSCYSVRNPQPFQLYLQSRSQTKQLSFLTPADKVNNWDQQYVFLSADKGYSINFSSEWKEETPGQLFFANFWLDERTNNLNQLFKDVAFDLQAMCANIPLLAFWGLLPCRERARSRSR